MNKPALPNSTPEHGIAVVERRTGISQHLLRAWERRYGVVEPGRDAGGERLYSDADIERLQLVRLVTEAGRRIGQVATLSLDELRTLAREDALAGTGVLPRVTTSERADSEVHLHLEACRAAIIRLDGNGGHALLMRAAVALGPQRFVEGVVLPLLRWIGDEWETGGVRVMHEHGMSVAMRRVLSWLVEALPAPSTAPLVICATLPGHRHEFGAMLAGVQAALRQWRVLYLGPDLPTDEIAAGAVLTGADAVALSAVMVSDSAALSTALDALRSALPAPFPIVVGGAGAVRHARTVRGHGAELLPDLLAWDAWLTQRGQLLAEMRA
jgi:DNA-binding transcriptional MerR regulator/methylmalonyl-CoA mutase cobalamin-binding subunit